MNIHLKLLREACLVVAKANTSCCPSKYNKKKSPLHGHCAAVACMVQGMFGGEIVTGRVKNEPHYWNRLPSGKEVDLTSCQFGGDGFTPFKKGRKVKRSKLIPVPFLMFAALVQEHLEKSALQPSK